MTTNSKDAAPRAMGASAVREALQEAISLRVKLYQNGCDCDREHTCNAEQRDPYAKKWAAVLAAQPEPSREVESVPAGYRLQPISEFDAYQEVLRDAERYRFLRDVPWFGTGTSLERVIAQQRNAHWDAAIDAAMSTPPAAGDSQ